MNYSDSERLETIIQNLSFRKAEVPEEADLIVFNTCSIRQKAEDRVYGLLEGLKSRKKAQSDLIVGITGCMVRSSSTRLSEKKDNLLSRLDTVDFAVRIEELAVLPRLLHEINPAIKPAEFQSDELENYFKIHPRYTSKFQTYVPIMKGCDKFCTYCIVPYSRGREKGRRIEEIVDEVKSLTENGCKEITLLGQNVNSYGKSMLDRKLGFFSHIQGSPFAYLLRELNKIENLKRLRFTSPHPQDMCDDVISAIGSLRVMCPYLHLPVQSGDNDMLKRMNRTYTREYYIKLVDKIRTKRPDIAISTDVIVGFCGETEEQFENTCRLFRDIEFDHAYISQYSQRSGTYAEKYFKDDVQRLEKKRRWQKLNSILRETSFKKNRAYKGKIVEVLVEQCLNGICQGRSEAFKDVRFSGDETMIGTFQKVKIVNGREWVLEGVRSKE